MGIINFFKDVFKFFGKVITKGLFIWWLCVIITVDFLLLIYHLMIHNGVYPPMSLFVVEMISFVPLILLALIGGILSGNVRNKNKQNDQRKNYDGLESRARFQ